MTTANPKWSFVTIVGEGDREKGAETGAAPPAGWASKTGIRGWIAKNWMTALISGIVVLILFIVILSIIIAAAAGAFSGATVTLTKVEATTCTGGTNKPNLLHATGSSSGDSTAEAVYLYWNATSNLCITTGKEDDNWPYIKGGSVSLGEGVPADVSKIEDDHLKLKFNDLWCPTYQRKANTDQLAPAGMSDTWPIVHITDAGALSLWVSGFQTCAR
ncbi:MAG: hypothetical protein CMI16_12670 [Opitutaceae bacterium]|nr:hypothetical protein [Opitutaceae bacterium]|tara:strand:+ start:315 stop:965 length:651 start_codon:yes stop_codon:yes gene_type:complete